MSKVKFENWRTEVFFGNLEIGNYFIFCDKIYLKINSLSAWNFEQEKFENISPGATIFFKSGNDIEIIVNK